jgi:hypothetical protein
MISNWIYSSLLSRLAAEYDLCPTLHTSQSLQRLQTPTLFPMNGSHSYFVGISAEPTKSNFNSKNRIKFSLLDLVY